MKLKAIAQTVSLSALGLALAVPAQAAFIEDSKASLELRNFYMNRDFRHDTATQSKAEEWAQGFLFRFESGYTEGTVGVGVDAMGFAGFKLDSGKGTSNTALLPRHDDGRAPSSYGELGATFKAKLSNSTLKAGTLMPKLPTVSAGDSRLLPQTFTGVHVNSQEINNLTVDLGRLNRVNQRNSTDRQHIYATIGQGTAVDKNAGKAGKAVNLSKNATSKFDFGSISYNWGDTGLKTAYHYGNLNNVYKQHILNGVYTLPITDGQSLTADVRYAKTNDDGKSNIDNKAISGLLSYKLGHSNFALGYQKMSGDTGYAYIAETDPFLANYVQIRDFAATDEKSWQARFIHDFASVGVPGLTLMTRYIRGTNIYMGANKSRGSEWERDTDIGYVFQDGTLKGLGIKWRNATLRSDVAPRKIDENRLIVSYTIPLM
ncbi:OprD family porin [Thiopseudomonas denitrificans]|uniref:Outer membrane OprD family porin n=1 Tax=Thiopseudomonas denitrificans TaxID=1501432 RepID=A0A4R6UA10_9GAMM|nr:OprD family porin [Thiopseudomonas denitrificans]TDQ39904.1 outer membrane OprD family porin [Thiopseudomonas denitrificans]